MIHGMHCIIYSTDADADRAFLRDVLELTHVDVGEGWLIFGLPPSEVAIHPAESNGEHELFLMCPDIEAFVGGMVARGIPCGPVQDQGWGLLTQLTLPGGGQLGVYEPRHARPPAADGAAPAAVRTAVRTAVRATSSNAAKPVKRAPKKPAKKPPKKSAKKSAKQPAKKSARKPARQSAGRPAKTKRKAAKAKPASRRAPRGRGAK